MDFLTSASFIYQLILGNFDTSNFNPAQLGTTWLLFILASLFLIVVMLNLLISIISDTFSRVSSQSKQLMYVEFTQLILEHKNLISDDDMRQQELKGRYLYLAWADSYSTKL